MMICPRCVRAVLTQRLREQVLIDTCPSCGGIWLDAGELELLTARTVPASPPRPDAEPAGPPGPRPARVR